jgi:sugar lactone lactonase YvrE
MESIDIIADNGDLCGESPLWDERSRTLFWTDITGRRFYRYLWAEKRHELVRAAFEVGGFALLEPDGFAVVNSDGVWLWDGAERFQSVAREVDGKRCVLNDCIADPEGRLFTGSCFFDPNRDDYELGFLLRVDRDGSAHIVEDGIRLSNGLGFSPDESTLYHVDSAARIIYAYDYSRANGALRNRRALVRVPVAQGVPDGLTVDAEGYIWCAHWFGGAIMRYRPDGSLERQIRIPAAQTSCVAFGGPDLTDIFVTSAAQPDALSLAPAGFDPQTARFGGQLFHLNLSIPGKPEYRARLSETGAGV